MEIVMKAKQTNTEVAVLVTSLSPGWRRLIEPTVAEISATVGSRSNRSTGIRTCAVVHMARGLAPDGSRRRGVRGARQALLKPFALVHYGRIST